MAISAANAGLYDVYYNGISWSPPVNLGAPAGFNPDTTWFATDPAVASLCVGEKGYEGGGDARPYVLVTGTNGHLYVIHHYFKANVGPVWSPWQDLGTPGAPVGDVEGVPGYDPNVRVLGRPSVTAYDVPDFSVLYAFVQGSNGHLLSARMGDDEKWHWTDQSTYSSAPASLTQSWDSATVTYLNQGTSSSDIPDPQVYTFIVAANGQLYAHWYDKQWLWQDLGGPMQQQPSDPLTIKAVGRPAVFSYEYGGWNRLYVFVRGQDDNLYVRFWDGTKWNWASQSNPSKFLASAKPGLSLVGDPSADTTLAPAALLTYGLGNVFVRGSDRHLYRNMWTGTDWKWADLGLAPSPEGWAGDPGAVIARRNGDYWTDVLAIGLDNKVHLFDGLARGDPDQWDVTGPYQWEGNLY
jgi:hypothetical protein